MEVRLKSAMKGQKRDSDEVSDRMIDDVIELLQLFGVPYIVSPMEAEAQCATLEQLKLVDGIITDDSDVFLFGGQCVYKNIFEERKFVEAFWASDVENELKIRREQMILMAQMLGSDYCEGIRGIGIVNAMEVIRAFPSAEMLSSDFKQWLQTYSLLSEEEVATDSDSSSCSEPEENDKTNGKTSGKTRGKKRKGRKQKKKKKVTSKRKRKYTPKELDDMDEVERFKAEHENYRSKWHVGENFPDPLVTNAYLHPIVDKSTDPFKWGLPNVDLLREYCFDKFAWTNEHTNDQIMPMVEKLKEKGSRQRRMDQYYTAYHHNARYATVVSKRLSRVVKKTKEQKPMWNSGTRRDSRVDDDDADSEMPAEGDIDEFPLLPEELNIKLELEMNGNAFSDSALEAKPKRKPKSKPVPKKAGTKKATKPRKKPTKGTGTKKKKVCGGVAAVVVPINSRVPPPHTSFPLPSIRNHKRRHRFKIQAKGRKLNNRNKKKSTTATRATSHHVQV
jgi:DNA excision repair protein ERCC-5